MIEQIYTADDLAMAYKDGYVKCGIDAALELQRLQDTSTQPTSAVVQPVHQEFRVMAQGKFDHELDAFPIDSEQFGVMLTIGTPEAAVYVTKAQAAAFFGFTHPPTPGAVVQAAQPEGQTKTGWAPGMLQDDCKGLSKWLSNTPNARQDARDAATPPPVAGDASRTSAISDAARHMADEYGAWIDFYHRANGSYEDFLKSRAAIAAGGAQK